MIQGTIGRIVGSGPSHAKHFMLFELGKGGGGGGGGGCHSQNAFVL